MEFLRPPWEHQTLALKMAMDLYNPAEPQASGFALFHEMGVGKTSTAINIWRAQCNLRQQFMRTLIFCPPIVCRNWREEFRLNSRVDLSQVVLLQGPGLRRLKTFLDTGLPGGERTPKIFVTNFESLLMKELYAAMKLWQPEALIVDEVHRVKNPSAKRSKLLERLANQGPVIPYKQILTGSPVLKDPMDLFMQFLILDGGRTFGGNFFAFRARFFRDRNAGMPKQSYFPNWKTMTMARDGFDALTEMNLRLQSRAMVVKKADCLDLPPLVKQVIKVGMTSTQAQMYREMKKDFITYANGEACVASLAITKALRMMQLSSGFIRSVEGVDHPMVENPKQEALKQLLEDLASDHKTLVWCVFKQNYKQVREVCASLGIEMVEITGEQSETQKMESVERFRSDPKVRVLCGHPQSGGIGLNLVEASYMIFYSRNFSLENDLQAEARCFRAGSERHEKITRIDLVTEDTIDEQVTEALASKQSVSFELLKNLCR